MNDISSSSTLSIFLRTFDLSTIFSVNHKECEIPETKERKTQQFVTDHVDMMIFKLSTVKLCLFPVGAISSLTKDLLSVCWVESQLQRTMLNTSGE